MFGALPHKTKQIFLFIVKLSIVFGAAFFISQKLTKNENLDFSVFYHFLIENDVFSSKNIIFLLFLTIFNWFFEILKWQNLVGFFKKISLGDAAKQSLASLTASIFTPNRIGEYAAKIAYYPKGDRKRIMMLNLLSNMSQMAITLLVGIVGLYFFTTTYDVELPWLRIARLSAFALMILFFFVFSVRQNRYSIKGLPLERVRNFINRLRKKLIWTTLLYAFIRYTIFSYQFYFFLLIFGIEVNYLNAMMLITSMYLLSSIIPTIFLLDVVVKGSIALYLFDIVGVNNLTVLTIITAMWLLNFVFPSILGGFFVLSFKRLKIPDEQNP